MAREHLVLGFQDMYNHIVHPTRGRVFPVFRPLVGHMTKLEALFLCNLLHLRRLSGTQAIILDNRVFFECSVALLKSSKQSLGWSRDEQMRHLQKLSSPPLQLIDVFYPEKHSKRHICIDMRRVWYLIQPQDNWAPPPPNICVESIERVHRIDAQKDMTDLGRWFSCLLDLGKEMPKLDILFLLDLCNIRCQKDRKGPRDWITPFQCSSYFLSDTNASMGWTQTEQRRALKSLSRDPHRLLEVSKKGNPATRHLRINLLELGRLLGDDSAFD